MEKRMIKNMCVISRGYPTADQPDFPFVDQLLCAMSQLGVHCTVISPQSVSKNILRSRKKRPTHWCREYEGNIIDIYQPYFISFSTLHIGKWFFSEMLFEHAVKKCFKCLNKKFDAIYGHFWTYGLIASKIGKKYNIPTFTACGESKIPYDALITNLKYKDFVNGIICVSTKSQTESVELGLCKIEDTIVCPNSIDPKVFYHIEKKKCREELGMPHDGFIVAFVGSFSNRKGSKRLSAALDRMDDVFSVFIGKGDEKPDCERRLFTGSLPHDQIVKYLCASDVFVLPTLNEGCCNAIVEAMACGLPIVSSNLPFNDDILNEEFSIRIDPNSVDEIEEAINKIKDDAELQKKMSYAALKKAESFTIENRAKRILSYMEARC